MNGLLTAEKYLPILCNAKVASAEVALINGKRYLRLQYSAQNISDLLSWANLTSGQQELLAPWTGATQIRAWIDLDTNFLSKAVARLRGKDPDGKNEVDIEIEQVFGSFEGDVLRECTKLIWGEALQCTTN